jgi:hypothetical protein
VVCWIKILPNEITIALRADVLQNGRKFAFKNKKNIFMGISNNRNTKRSVERRRTTTLLFVLCRFKQAHSASFQIYIVFLGHDSSTCKNFEQIVVAH